MKINPEADPIVQQAKLDGVYPFPVDASFTKRQAALWIYLNADWTEEKADGTP